MKYLVFFVAVAFLMAGCGNRVRTGVQVGVRTPVVEKETLLVATLGEHEKQIVEKTSPRTVERMERGELITVNDVIKLSQSGVSDDIIIGYIRKSRASYNLSQVQVRRMQESGVSQRTINFMVDTGR